ncbi:hypothetical protein OE699_09335 [Sedimentimonas flavescens]|uniref:Uncharacterized protein n=1 Tax=Sedimentimonas flavescens TaxID=2851012 RepID=A0ABT2ZZ84_9RHOB|nr:hypothetical protein [Sedimentimonas flavescens]MCV2879057.1 hypothetical protein [Sedimentimonas flavescens]
MAAKATLASPGSRQDLATPRASCQSSRAAATKPLWGETAHQRKETNQTKDHPSQRPVEAETEPGNNAHADGGSKDARPGMIFSAASAAYVEVGGDFRAAKWASGICVRHCHDSLLINAYNPKRSASDFIALKNGKYVALS